MLKRGQITFFLVLGIIILLVSAGLFLVFSNIKKAPLEIEEKEAQKIPGVRETLRTYVENCIEETVNPSIYLLAIQGGIIYPNEDSLILLTDYGMVNYAWINGLDGLSKEKMEEDLAAYLEEYVPSCLGTFETFTKQNILVEPGYSKVKAEITIKDKNLEVIVQLPITVILPNGDEMTLDRFSAPVQSSLGKILTSIERLQFPNVGPSDLIDLPYQSTIFPYDEAVMIYSLSEEDKEAPLSFMFAVRNDFPGNKAPSLHHIADKTFRVGDRWQEVLAAEDSTNDLLDFSSDSTLFPVQKDGTIDMQITQAGEFDVTFTVKDHRGGEDMQMITITVASAEE